MNIEEFSLILIFITALVLVCLLAFDHFEKRPPRQILNLVIMYLILDFIVIVFFFYILLIRGWLV
mgnify:CR=1 FL=1